MVARQTILCRQVANASTEAEPSYTRRNDNASGRDETEGLSRRVEIQPGRATLGTGDPHLSIHFNFSHSQEINYKSAITNTVTSGIVSSSSHSHLKFVRSREIECNRNILSTNTARDHRGAAVNQGIETATGCVVLGVRREDKSASQRTPQLIQILI
jgi:hypothetical protein